MWQDVNLASLDWGDTELNVLKLHKKSTVVTLLERGDLSQRQIAMLAGVNRRTVKVIAEELWPARSNCTTPSTGPGQTAPPRPPGPPLAASACEPHRGFIEAQLRLRRNATAIYQDLVDRHGFGAGYASVKRFVQKLRDVDPVQYDRLEFACGEEAQVDYGEGAPTLDPASGRYRKPRLFVMTLRYSGRCFRRVVWNSSQETWARLHEQAWTYWLRRRVRVCYWKQWRPTRTKVGHLLALGVSKRMAILTGVSSKSNWHLSRSQATQIGMTNDWLKAQGLVSIRDLWMKAHGYS